MTREIRVAVSPGEWRTALIEDGRPVEFWVERPARPDGVGDLVRVRVAALAPAMAGAFCTLPGDVTGFLPESEAGQAKAPIAKQVSEGMAIAVRVTRAAQGGKGPRLTARLTPEEAGFAAAAEAGAPRLLRRGRPAALRLAARFPAAPLLCDGLALAAAWGVPPLRGHAFDDELEAGFDEACGPAVPLPGGGRMSIHPTPALVAIDVDAGSAAGARGDALPALNAAAIAQAARQIRLRNLAGAILVDVAGLPAKKRAALAEPFAAALAPDPLARLIGVTGLGLVEIQRARVHAPLHEVMAGPLAAGLAALRAAGREAASRGGARLALRAVPAVIAALRDLPGALEAYAGDAGFPLALRPDATAAGWTIEESDDGR
ncbi:MAG TPA: ribonuclease E/G [Roseomonas sp.]|jgi:hypothetical protein